MDELRGLGYDVVTRLEKAGAFYEAEAYHQDFARRTGRAVAIWPCPVSSAVLTAARAKELAAYP